MARISLRIRSGMAEDRHRNTISFQIDVAPIVAEIGRLAARLNCQLWVERVDTKANPGDAFSRSREAEKQNEADDLAKRLNAYRLRVEWPQNLKAWD